MRTRRFRLVLLVGLLLLVGVGWALDRALERGFSARAEPAAVEALVARTLRRLATPRRLRDAANPVPLTPEVLAEARAHFADHCASCHGNDGRGQTSLGRSLYPKAPDMTLPPTQSLTDGEIFAIIENGVRLTGMPAWGTGSPEGERESWKLVHFVRRLPRITEEELAEMRELNPRSRSEWEEEEQMRRFLEGGAAPPEAHRH